MTRAETLKLVLARIEQRTALLQATGFRSANTLLLEQQADLQLVRSLALPMTGAKM